MSYSVEIVVVYKEGTLNPEAKAIKSTLFNLVYNFEEFDKGKYFRYISNQKTKKDARREAEEIADKLLTPY